jgi:hypothetical protein
MRADRCCTQNVESYAVLGIIHDISILCDRHQYKFHISTYDPLHVFLNIETEFLLAKIESNSFAHGVQSDTRKHTFISQLWNPERYPEIHPVQCVKCECIGKIETAANDVTRLERGSVGTLVGADYDGRASRRPHDSPRNLPSIQVDDRMETKSGRTQSRFGYGEKHQFWVGPFVSLAQDRYFEVVHLTTTWNRIIGPKRHWLREHVSRIFDFPLSVKKATKIVHKKIRQMIGSISVV